MQHLWKLITTTKMLRFLKRSYPTLKILRPKELNEDLTKPTSSHGFLLTFPTNSS